MRCLYGLPAIAAELNSSFRRLKIWSYVSG